MTKSKVSHWHHHGSIYHGIFIGNDIHWSRHIDMTLFGYSVFDREKILSLCATTCYYDLRPGVNVIANGLRGVSGVNVCGCGGVNVA